MEKDYRRIAAAMEKAVEHEDRVMPGAIRLAFLHGSLARGKADAESDIDIGILASASLDKAQRYELRIRLMRSLADTLNMPLEKIDLVILQDVPVLLQFHVIRNGIVLFERDRSERIAYALRVEQFYDDERYYLERESQATIDRILSRPAA